MLAISQAINITFMKEIVQSLMEKSLFSTISLLLVRLLKIYELNAKMYLEKINASWIPMHL